MSAVLSEAALPCRNHHYTFRRATRSDAPACSDLIFSSGPKEFAYLFNDTDERCVAFLEYAFAMRFGRFSYRHHHVAVRNDGQICATLATHTRIQLWLGDIVFAGQLLRRYGVAASARILVRGHVLSSTLARPNRGEVLISHCATHVAVRSRGIFRRLFRHVTTARLCAGKAWLNVLDSNIDARRLYVRLGFADAPKSPRRSRNLPASLNTRSMYWRACPQENAS
ncbi:GNAT family N-acetyltransferase [Pandoraea captiosa]|uniref:GNAT family N-acetyltransferase n=1 Tax=Pandoraea captiosa TaxID=2508302 RepID=UPI001241BA41|nr:GNAT family N-acetyltransferase [Pandoraea captiosa]